MGLTSDRPLYMDETKTRLLEEGHPEARYILAGAGTPIDPDDAERLGLEEQDGRIVTKAQSPVEDKAVSGPEETKGLHEMTKAELLAEAERRGVEVAPDARKAEIHETLSGA